MKETRQPFSWITYLFDFNSKKVEAYDVLKYREKFIKKFKKECQTKEAFGERLFRDFQWQYWSRCEYEMILYIEDGRVFAEPWPPGPDTKSQRIDITDYPGFDWLTFTKDMIDKQGYRDETVKVDIYDQLEFRKQEVIDFCWNYRHKYQRTMKAIME